VKKPVYRDSSGMTLAEYDHPNVAVDTVALAYDIHRGLQVLVVERRGGGWALPGTFLHTDEVLAEAVQRSLKGKVGVKGLKPWQLKVFDALGRDDRGWVLSVAHCCVIPAGSLAKRDKDRTRLLPADKPGKLAYDHDKMVQLALTDLRARYDVAPDPDRLLGDTFTLRQLAMVHGAVAGETVTPEELDTFRRYMEQHLEWTGGYDPEGPGRPARVFSRKADSTEGRLTAEVRTVSTLPGWRRRRPVTSRRSRTSRA
jgi:8-oxo-dGTP diphosphatase